MSSSAGSHGSDAPVPVPTGPGGSAASGEAASRAVPPADRVPGSDVTGLSPHVSGVANVAELVGLAARRRPHATAIRCLDGDGATLATRTWAELEADVARLAGGLRASGSAPGDRVVLLLRDPVAFVVAIFGSLRAGCIAVPLNPTLTPHEVTARVSVVRPRVLLADPTTTGSVEENDDPDRVVVVLGTPSWDHLALGLDARNVPPTRGTADPTPAAAVVVATPAAAAEAAAPRATATPAAAVEAAATPAETAADPRDAEHPAVLLFTAGTGGRPRPAILTHRAVVAAVGQQLRLDPAPMRPDDAALVAVPAFHASGLVAGLVSAAATGATLLLPVAGSTSVPNPGEVGATTVLGSPHLFATWSASPDVVRILDGVRLLGCVGAPLPSAVAAGLATLTGATPWTGYSTAETASLVTASLGGPVSAGSVGSALPGVELALRDDAGAPVDDSDPGEVWVRADSLFSGYWPDGADGPDTDGWFATGDVGYLDDAGALHLVDRRREVVFVSGFNVYPREVEQAIATHPDVLECAVVGVPHPVTGEAVKAYVVPRPGAILTVDDVLGVCATRLARFKRPTIVVMTDALPHTEAGTVVKALLRVEADRRPHTDGAPA